MNLLPHMDVGDESITTAMPATNEQLYNGTPEQKAAYAREMFKPDLMGGPINIGHTLQGAAQSAVNFIPNLINLPIRASNWLNKTDAPTIPTAHFAPDDVAARRGEFAFDLLTGAGGAGIGVAARPAEEYSALQEALQTPQKYVEPGIVGKTKEFITPGKQAKELTEQLSGNTGTQQENIDQLARRINLAYQSNKADALADKSEVISAIGDKKLDELPGFSEEKVAKVFDPSGTSFTPQNVTALSQAIKQYYRTGDLDKFVEKGKDLFGTEDITAQQVDKLDDMLSKKNLSYTENVKASDIPTNDLRETHNKFIANPTFENADALQSEYGNEIGYYQRRSEMDKLEPHERDILSKLVKNQKMLLQDMYDHIDQLPPELRDKYQSFRTKWKENVVPYHAVDVSRDIVKGKTKPAGKNLTNWGIKPGDIKSDFSYNDKNAAKIAEDIGPTGRGNVITNELREQNIPAGNAEKLGEALLQLHGRGYQGYIDPRLQQMAESLMRRGRLMSRVKGGLTGAGVGLMTGIPYGTLIGAVGGATTRDLLPEIIKRFGYAKK